MTFICNSKGKATDEVIADGVAFLDNLDIAIAKARTEIAKAFQDKGHPYGAQGDTAIDMFVFSLVYAIRSAGGNVATSRTAGSSPKHIEQGTRYFAALLAENSPRLSRG